LPLNVDKLVETLIAEPHESDWFEFKHNRVDPDQFGEYVSALANSAILAEKRCAYLVYGVEDETHKVVGTTVDLHAEKVGNEAFTNWIVRMLDPRLSLTIEEGLCHGKRVVVVEIDPAYQQPVRFKHVAYIRHGSHKRKLSDFREKERALWLATGRHTFERNDAIRGASSDQVMGLIDIEPLFDLLQEPRPGTEAGVLDRLAREEMIASNLQGGYDVSNLALLALARNLGATPSLARKAVRVIRYRGTDKLETLEEEVLETGYAAGFQNLLRTLLKLVPSHEEIVNGVRRSIPIIPELALRETLANALIHQDLTTMGAGPLIEIYTDRVEVTNPGEPLVEPDRFLDAPPRSRNETLASLMRRLGICEERGSGIDKIVASIEQLSLPPPLFRAVAGSMVVTLFSDRPFAKMSSEERIRACYQHACLRYAAGEAMSNTTLRERLRLQPGQYPQASLVIRAAIDADRIKPLSEDQGRRNARYIPFWAQ
jgi:ATP-dependent DNA helicase RecG